MDSAIEVLSRGFEVSSMMKIDEAYCLLTNIPRFLDSPEKWEEAREIYFDRLYWLNEKLNVQGITLNKKYFEI